MSDCYCIRCTECRGTGTVFVAVDGTYLGSGRSDDLDEAEVCDQCDGDGLFEICWECAQEVD